MMKKTYYNKERQMFRNLRVNAPMPVRIKLTVVATLFTALSIFMPSTAWAVGDQLTVNFQESECANIPAPRRGITLRVVNFQPHDIYVRKPGSGFSMAPGEIHDVIVTAQESWEWIDEVGGIRRPIVLEGGSTQCYVVGTKSAQSATAPAASAQEDTFPLLAGRTIVRGQKYRSESGNHYLIFQPDGNVVVYTAADQYVWGLESITDKYQDAQSVQMQDDGNFVVRDADGEYIWSALDANPDSSAYLTLTPEGVLQLVSGQTGAILWASNDDLSAVLPTAVPTAEATTAPTTESTAVPVEPTTAPVEATVVPTVEATVEPTAAPTAEPTTVCTQEDFLAVVKEGETSGTIALDGSCRYLLTSAGDNWNGGSGALLRKTTLVEGNGAIIERDASAPSFRILAIEVPDGITVRNVTIRNGATTEGGGGLYASSSVTLEDVTLEDNTADKSGGAISHQSSDLIIKNSRIFNNGATDIGGAIYKEKGNLNVINTVFAQNRAKDGAAVYIGGSVIDTKVTNSTVTDNAGNAGTAITVWAPLTLRNTIIANHKIAVTAGGDKTVLNEDHNLFANNATDVLGISGANVVRSGHSVQVPDPRFVDATALNYALTESSAAVDKGTDAGVLSTDAASMARPFSGTLVDIGAYEYQGEGGPSLSIVKLEPYWIADGYKAEYSLKIANDGIRSAEALVVDVLPDGANYVADSAGEDATFTDGRLTWQIATLAPGESTFLSYRVVASQSLVSSDYSVHSATEPAVIAQGNVVTSPLNSNIVANLDFFPRWDGFAFQNYSDSPDSDLTVDDMIFIFGDGVCKSKSPCVLTATAESWRKQWIENVKGGHCAGMAMGSLDIFASTRTSPFTKDWVSPSSFENGADDTYYVTYDLDKLDARKYIALYATTQGSRPADTSKLGDYEWDPTDNPIDVLNILTSTLNSKVLTSTLDSHVFTSTLDSKVLISTLNGKVLTSTLNDNVSTSIPDGSVLTSTLNGNVLTSILDGIVLTSTLNGPKLDLYRLNISYYPPRPGAYGGGGHAVMPYAVEQLDPKDANGNYLIYVYDNNFPNDFDRTIKINRSTGEWSYVTATNPNEPLNNYRGNKNTNNLTLTSWQWARTFPKECLNECVPQPRATETNTSQRIVGTVEVQLDGEGYPLVTRSDGKQVGFDLNTGEWISEIEGAESVEMLLGLGLNIPPAIQIPHEEGMSYGVQIASRETAYGNTEAPANVNISGPGFAVRVTDLVLNSPESQPISSTEDALGQDAQLTTSAPDLMGLNVDPDQKRITFEPGVDNAETPSISLAVSQADGSDFSVDVKNVNVAQGHAVALTFNEENQSITIEGNSADQTDYQVEVNRINTDGTTDTFVSDSVSDEGNAGVTLKVGDEWDGEETPEIQLEENSTLPAPIAGDEAQAVDEAANASSDDAAAATEQVPACDLADMPAPTETDVMVRFINASDAVGVVFWRDANNELQEYHRLNAGDTVDQETFIDHEWVVEDAAGNVLLDYQASAEEKQCAVITQP